MAHAPQQQAVTIQPLLLPIKQLLSHPTRDDAPSQQEGVFTHPADHGPHNEYSAYTCAVLLPAEHEKADCSDDEVFWSVRAEPCWHAYVATSLY